MRRPTPSGLLSSSLVVLAALGSFGGALAVPSAGHAQIAMPVLQLDDGAVRVDGMLRDWTGARRIDLGQGPGGAMHVAIGHDATGLYVAAEVEDERLVRAPAPARGAAIPGDGEDAVVLTLALPAGRGLEAVEIWMHPGEPGRSAAAITIGPIGARRRSAVRGGQVVEAPRAQGQGYTLEAFIPFAAIPHGSAWQEGRGSIRLHDVDSLAHPEPTSEPALAPVDRAHLELLPSLRPSGGQSAQLEQFLASQHIEGTAPRFDLRGNVVGDAQLERVLLVDRYVVAFGPSIQGGRGYVYVQLAVDQGADLREARLEDLTGDGTSELVVTLRQRGGGGSRDLLQVLRIDDQRIAPLWGLETRKETPAGSVESTVRVERGRRGQPPTITVRAGEAHGLDASSLREAPASDVEPMLLPWGPALERSFRWDGSHFASAGERPNPHYVDPASRPTTPSATPTTTATTTPTAPTAPTPDALLAEFRRQRGLPASARPFRELTANVAGTATPERVVVYGRDLVVVGPEFRNGTGWFAYELPAREPADLLDVRAVDVTGDGRAEIVARVRQAIGDVRREVLLVHQLTPTGFPALLQREVAREQGGSRIENEVRFEGGHLEIRPGTARGWSEASWPYGNAPSTDGVELLLLPWRDHAITFRVDGTRLRGS